MGGGGWGQNNFWNYSTQLLMLDTAEVSSSQAFDRLAGCFSYENRHIFSVWGEVRNYKISFFRIQGGVADFVPGDGSEGNATFL